MTEYAVRERIGERVRIAPFLAERQTSGHHPRSLYVERFWLPILGPGTTMLVRHVALLIDDGEDSVGLDEIAAAIGLAHSARREGAFFRALERAVAFEVLRVVAPEVLFVRALLPDVSPRRRLQLSAPLRRLESQLGASAVRLPGPGRPH